MVNGFIRKLMIVFLVDMENLSMLNLMAIKYGLCLLKNVGQKFMGAIKLSIQVHPLKDSVLWQVLLLSMYLLKPFKNRKNFILNYKKLMTRNMSSQQADQNISTKWVKTNKTGLDWLVVTHTRFWNFWRSTDKPLWKWGILGERKYGSVIGLLNLQNGQKPWEINTTITSNQMMVPSICLGKCS